MTRTEMQDMVLAKFEDKLADTITIRERISLKFTEWFQKLVEPPKPKSEDKSKSEGGGAGGGEGGEGGA